MYKGMMNENMENYCHEIEYKERQQKEEYKNRFDKSKNKK